MTEKLKELLDLLEERLVEHDENRKEVQRELQEKCSKIREDADPLEEKMSEKIQKDFNAKEEEIFGLIKKLNGGKYKFSAMVKQARGILSKEWKYEIQHSGSPEKSFAESYELKVSSVDKEKELDFFDNTELIISQLQEKHEKIRESMAAAQEKLGEICNKRREEGDELEKRINGRLEEAFKAEDARIQSVVKIARERIDSEDPEEVKELARNWKLTLAKKQEYSLSGGGDSHGQCYLKVEKEASLKVIDFEERKPADLVISFTDKGELSLSFTFFSEDEVDVLKDIDLPLKVEVKMWDKGHEEDTPKTLTKVLTLGSDEPVCFRSIFMTSTTYCLKMKIVHQRTSSQWSDETEFITPKFKDLCVWKECPNDVYSNYSVDEKNLRIATKTGYGDCTIIGGLSLPPNKVTSWSIKVLKTKNNGGGIIIGVVPSDINQNDNNYNKCGWYFYCYDSTLHSGPPHNYREKEYGPRKGKGEYVHTGDSVGVVMVTEKGELSFALNGVNLGVAYEGIPLDKSLVPCVLLGNKGDSVELVI